MSRQNFPARVKAAVLRRCSDENGVPHCESCGVAGRVEIDHWKADGLGGEPTEANAVALCRNCHSTKTHTHDRPIMAKADRQRKKHFLGRKPPSRPMPGTKASGIRKRMSGQVEPWR